MTRFIRCIFLILQLIVFGDSRLFQNEITRSDRDTRLNEKFQTALDDLIEAMFVEKTVFFLENLKVKLEVLRQNKYLEMKKNERKALKIYLKYFINQAKTRHIFMGR